MLGMHEVDQRFGIPPQLDGHRDRFVERVEELIRVPDLDFLYPRIRSSRGNRCRLAPSSRTQGAACEERTMKELVLPVPKLVIASQAFQTLIQLLLRGAGGARTHDRRIMSPPTGRRG